jgi:tetratricopeptide (TPR) repeat protein
MASNEIMSDDELDQLLRRGIDHLESGDVVQARDRFADAVHRAETVLGTDSVELVDPLMLLAHAQKLAGDESQQLALHARALAIADEHLIGEPSRFASLLVSVAVTYERSGALDIAAGLLVRALAFQRAVSEDVWFTLLCLTHVLLNAGRAPEALPYAEEKLALGAKRATLEEQTLGDVLDLAMCLRDSGRRDEALPMFKRGLAIAKARADVPELRVARRNAVAEIEAWIAELERALTSN